MIPIDTKLATQVPRSAYEIILVAKDRHNVIKNSFSKSLFSVITNVHPRDSIAAIKAPPNELSPKAERGLLQMSNPAFDIRVGEVKVSYR